MRVGLYATAKMSGRSKLSTAHVRTHLQVVSGLTIEGEAFALDGKHIVDCTLVNCVLEYSGGEVVLERTQLRGCRHVFYGQARLTLHYLQGVGLMPYAPAEWGEFSDVVH